MRAITSLSFSVCLFLLVGCGGGGGSSSTGGGSNGTSNSSVTSGNWSLVASSSVVANTSYIGGSLTQSGSSLSATMHIDHSSCYELTTDVPLSGTITGSSFTLTSSIVNSQVITVTGTITNSSTLQGTYSIAGGCAAGDRGTVSGVLVPSVNGTWKATDSSTGTTVTITGTITQSATGTADGIFLLTGSFTYSGSPCSTGGTLLSDSFIAGDVVGVDAQTNDTGGVKGETVLVAILNNPTSPTSFSGSYQILSGACSGETGTLNFVKQ